MTGKTETFLNGQRTAELWAAIKGEFCSRREVATDEEVAEMLDETLGVGGPGPPGESAAATDREVAEMLDEVFGHHGGTSEPSEANIASDEEVNEMLNEVFATS